MMMSRRTLVARPLFPPLHGPRRGVWPVVVIEDVLTLFPKKRPIPKGEPCSAGASVALGG